MVLAADLNLCGLLWSGVLDIVILRDGGLKVGLTAVRTRQSSGVRYRSWVVSSLMFFTMPNRRDSVGFVLASIEFEGALILCEPEISASRLVSTPPTHFDATNVVAVHSDFTRPTDNRSHVHSDAHTSWNLWCKASRPKTVAATPQLS